MGEETRRGALKKRLGRLGRYQYVLLIAVLGIVLMLWPSSHKKEIKSSGAGPPIYDLEQELRSILGKIRGVGRVDVVLTLQSTGEEILASDTELSYRGAAVSPEDYKRSTTTVTVPGSGVIVTERRYPQYRGALVVCDGGGTDSVRLCVIEAVSALTGLGADRIAVVPWEQKSGDP